MKNDWKPYVQGSGDVATNGHTLITDMLDVDDTYWISSAEQVVHARTQSGVDLILEEFDIPQAPWRNWAEAEKVSCMEED
jgi:hypothetical protein